MIDVSKLTEEQYEALLNPVWRFLAVEDAPTISDIIFVFGGLDMAVPTRASDLYLQGFSSTILVSGSSGPFSKDVFDKPEAYVFSEAMIKRGVPESSIILETKATNTLENVLFGMRALQEKSKQVSSAILIGKSFLMRRCIATFTKQYPNIKVISCPPLGKMNDFRDRSREDFAQRLVAEIERIKRYALQGDLSEQPIPPLVAETIEIIKNGFQP